MGKPCSCDKENRSKDSEKWIGENYKLCRTLGRGASSKVLECEEKATGKKYALKIMLKSRKRNEELYYKETEILKLLTHKNIVSFEGRFQDFEHFYLLTNLCSGGELFDRIVDRRTFITEVQAGKLVRTMLLAVGHCHQKHVVHRDLKPENFVFKTKAKKSDLVLIDFGLARRVEDDTVYEDFVGTPFYLAPECAVRNYVKTGRILKASDVWSIGVIAYVLMTGRPPFSGKSNSEILRKIVKTRVKVPRGIVFSEVFSDFIKKILTKSPGKRIRLQDALAHPWLKGKKVATDKPIPESVIKVLRQFNKQSKLKKAITKVLANKMNAAEEEQIRTQFNRVDLNNDGMLSSDEIAILLMDIGYSKHNAYEEASNIISSADENKNGKIEFKEFSQIYQRKILSADEAYIHAVFNVMDTNGDGNIDATELASVLEMTVEGEGAKLEELIKEVDSNQDGVINFAEFRAAMIESGSLMGTLDGRESKTGLTLELKDIVSEENFLVAGEEDVLGVGDTITNGSMTSG